MTLDEAIRHCEEVAEENDLAAGTYELLAENNHNLYEKLTAETNSSRCAECAADHRQLAKWLTELKELESKHWDECRQIAHYDDEIKRLESAVVQPVRHGRWIAENRDNRGYADCYTCTNCNCYTYTYTLMKDCEYDYCPNCGADMRGDTE